MSEETEDVYSIMSWYGSLPMYYNDIEELIFKRRKLIGFYNIVAKYYKAKLKEYNNKHANRRIKEAKELMGMLDAVDPPTLGKASAQAIINIEPEYANAYDLKGECEGLKIIKEAVDNCLSAMMQDIADLRQLRGSRDRTEQDTD